MTQDTIDSHYMVIGTISISDVTSKHVTILYHIRKSTSFLCPDVRSSQTTTTQGKIKNRSFDVARRFAG